MLPGFVISLRKQDNGHHALFTLMKLMQLAGNDLESKISASFTNHAIINIKYDVLYELFLYNTVLRQCIVATYVTTRCIL